MLSDNLETIAQLMFAFVKDKLDEIADAEDGQNMVFALGYAQGLLYKEADELRKEGR